MLTRGPENAERVLKKVQFHFGCLRGTALSSSWVQFLCVGLCAGEGRSPAVSALLLPLHSTISAETNSILHQKQFEVYWCRPRQWDSLGLCVEGWPQNAKRYKNVQFHF
jgi:hypothetical protein